MELSAAHRHRRGRLATHARALTSILGQLGHRDAEALADALLCECGSLGGVLAAPPHRLLRACGDRAVTRHLASLGEAFRLSLRDAAFDGERITGTAALARYLAATMSHLPREEVRVLFLSAKSELLADETLFVGSVDTSALEARPIIHRALDLAATGLIVVHNHPSGCAEPSAADVAATRRLAQACKALSISVHDHIVVGRGNWSSFRDRGLL